MRRKIVLFGLFFAGLSLIALRTKGIDKITIRIDLFQGEPFNDQSDVKKIHIVSTNSIPKISSLFQKAQSTPNEIRAALIEALLEVYNLQSIEDIFSHAKLWNRKRPGLDDVVLGNKVAYRIKSFPKNISDERISVRTVISRTREGILRDEISKEKELSDAYRTTRNDNQMEVIVDQTIDIDIGCPAIIYVPREGRIFLVMISLTSGYAIDSIEQRRNKKDDESFFLAEAPHPIRNIQPAYPEELRQRRIGGEIGLYIKIDEKGEVKRVDVEKHLHPYLDYAAVQAFRRWAFEPARRGTKPTPAEFRYSYVFNPWLDQYEETWENPAPADSLKMPQTDLMKLLDKTGEYCRNLEKAALFFICEETIEETHYSLLKNIKWANLILWNRPIANAPGYWNMGGREVQIMDPKLTKRNRYICDYQIIRDQGKIKEQRFILKKNGKKLEQKMVLDESRFSALSSLYAAQRVLMPERQTFYDFRIAGNDRVHGENAYILEASPKGETWDWIWLAKIWIGKKGFQILKYEITGIPVDGYEDVLSDCAILNIQPFFVTSYEYRNENKSLCYPSRTSIRVDYPAIDFRGPVTKIVINLLYEKYRYFNVETAYKITK